MNATLLCNIYYFQSFSSCSLRTLAAVITQERLKIIYFAYVHSIMSYGIIFWGSSSYSNLNFQNPKKNSANDYEGRKLILLSSIVKQLNILSLHSQYIFSLSVFVVKNLNVYKFNTAIHSTNTRQGSHLHFPANKLFKVQKDVYYSGIKIVNNLLQSIRNLLTDVITFKQALKKVSFYWFISFLKWILWMECEGWSWFL
jgi:hypothetical protein